jgi:hypothetical protein
VILDSQNEFSDAQAVTASAISSNVIDTHAALGGGTALTPGQRVGLGVGEMPYLVVRTVVAATDTGSDATLTITLESADDAGLSTNVQVHFSSGPLAFATFSPANGQNLIAVPIPPAFLFRRYLGVRYTVANGPLTAGAFDAFLSPDLGGGTLVYRSATRVQ